MFELKTKIMTQTHVKTSTYIAIITAAMSVMVMVGYAQAINPNHASYESNCDGNCNDNYLKYSQHLQNNFHSCNVLNSGLCASKVINPT